MAALEIIALDTVTPRLRAPGAGDTYSMPVSVNMTAPGGGGYFGGASGNFGMQINTGVGSMYLLGNGVGSFSVGGTAYDGCTSALKLGLCAPGTLYAPDVGLERLSAGVMKITNGANGATGAGIIRLPTFTVAGLPTVANAGAGGRATVSDGSVAMAANYGAIVAGGGANVVPVFCDGVNWRIG